MGKRRDDFEDDGRTIADMSDTGRMPLLIPHRLPGKRDRKEESGQTRPESPFSRDEQKGAAWGALSAALLIGAVFMAGIAAAIWIMILVWK